MEMLQWPKKLNMEPTPPKMHRFTSRNLATEWNVNTNPSTPTVSCCVNQHSPGIPPHLIAKCDLFRKYSPTDRTQLIRRNNRCLGCWLPHRLKNGKMHNGDDCDYPRHCRKYPSLRHHEALCGAALVMRSTYEKARQAGEGPAPLSSFSMVETTWNVTFVFLTSFCSDKLLLSCLK